MDRPRVKRRRRWPRSMPCVSGGHGDARASAGDDGVGTTKAAGTVKWPSNRKKTCKAARKWRSRSERGVKEEGEGVRLERSDDGYGGIFA
uniref:Uncharacterized protein n=1 Tax=Hyaloperonospora arabidopsidis (strain Emoy2) TaxID=559515 RepID=M4C2Q4_HYAAE